MGCICKYSWIEVHHRPFGGIFIVMPLREQVAECGLDSLQTLPRMFICVSSCHVQLCVIFFPLEFEFVAK